MKYKSKHADDMRWLRNNLQDALNFDLFPPAKREAFANKYGYCHVEIWQNNLVDGNRLVRCRIASLDPLRFCDTAGIPRVLKGPLSVTVETWAQDGAATRGRENGTADDVIGHTAARLGALVEKVLVDAGYTLTRAVQTDLFKLYRNNRAQVWFFPAG